MIELRELSIMDGRDIFDMLKEIGPGENGFMNSAYGVSFEDFPQYILENIEYSKGINLRPGYVPQTIYWLYEDSKPVGIGKVRHYLNDFLLNCGGHIGYCIRPAERGKGYGTIILKKLLEEARNKEIPEALLTCDDTNIPSRKVIERNSGILRGISEGECKYWIKL